MGSLVAHYKSLCMQRSWDHQDNSQKFIEQNTIGKNWTTHFTSERFDGNNPVNSDVGDGGAFILNWFQT